MLKMLRKSIRLFDPQADAVLLTDTESPLPGLNTKYELQRGQIRWESLMFERTVAQLHYLQANEHKEPIAFIDSDMLVNARLDSIFEHDFDVALTWRRSANMPINGGLIIVNNLRPAHGLQFMTEFKAIYESHYSGEDDWYGDQYALRDWLGMAHREMKRNLLVDVRGCRVLLLDCDHFNHSPPENACGYVARDPKVRIMHFKGARKRFMRRYYEAHLDCMGPRQRLQRLRQWRARTILTGLERECEISKADDRQGPTDQAPNNG